MKNKKSLARHKNAADMSPDQFHSNMVRLAHQSPSDAAEVANTWRERFMNAASATQERTVQALGVVAGTGSSFLIGLLDGHLNAVEKHAVDKWNAGGREAALAAMQSAGVSVPTDPKARQALMPWNVSKKYGGMAMRPTALWVIPYSVLITAGMGIAALARLGERYGIDQYFKMGAIGGASYVTGSLGFMLTYDNKMKQLKAAPAQGGNQAAA